MLSLCIFIFFFSFVVSIPEWTDKSTKQQSFDVSSIITGIAVDSSNSYQYITLTNQSSGLSYLYNSNQGGVSASTSLTHIDTVWRFSDYNKIFYCSEKENLLFFSSTSSLDLSSKSAADSSEIPSDAYLRCYDYTKNSGKVLLINFINSKIINKYELNTNNIYTAKIAEHSLKAFVKMPYIKSTTSDVYLYVLYEEKDKKVYLMRTENSDNGNINPVGILEFENPIELFDTVEISVIASRCKFEKNKFIDYVMIFTYEKEGKNFKYYYVYFNDQSKPTVISYGDDMTFPHFKNFTIQKFKFIKDTTLFFYHITAEDNTSFIGTGDLLYNILIYNIKQNVSSLSLDNTNRNSHYQNLLYSINNTVYSVCPFVKVNSNCDMLSESSLGKMRIDLSGNTEVSSCTLNSIGRYCVEECPSGYQSMANQCNQCEKFYNTTSKKCVDICDSYYVLNINTKMCYNCSDINKFYYNGECIDDCDSIYAENIYGVCHVCKDSNMWYQDKKCVSQCSKGYGQDTIHNTCTFCQSINKFYLNGKCVDHCDSYQLSDINNICYYCNETSLKYYEDKKCVSQCSEHYIISGSEEICESCASLNLTYYIDNKTCVNECPRGYETKENEKKCIDCIGNGKLVYIDKCVDVCPSMTYSDSDLFCKKCFCNGEHSTCLNNEDNTYTCQCMSGLTGTHCEIEHFVQKDLNIYSLKDPVIRNQDNAFSFHYTNMRGLADSMLGREKVSTITWGLSYKNISDNDSVDESGFINGVNETVFKLKKGMLKENCVNVITLSYTDINSNVTYFDSLTIAIRTIQGDLSLSLDVDEYIPMETNVTMSVVDSLHNREDKLCYRFYYKDELGEKIAITAKLLLSTFTTMLPAATRIVAEVSNDWNEVLTIEKEISYKKSGVYTKTIDDILSIEDRYTKLQSLNYHFAVNGTFTAKQIDSVLSYANEELNKEIINEAERIESKTSQGILFQPNQYISLINKIAISLQKQNDIEILSKISDIVTASTNTINSYSQAGISKSTLLSLYRNIDIINEISFDSAALTNRKAMMNIRDYISRNMGPGEQIKIVGKTIRTFIDQPGAVQDHLYIKKSSNKKFDSFDDYEFDNQFKAENCSSETSFCISNSEFNKLYDEVTYLKNEEISKLTFTVIEIDSTAPVVTSTGEKIEKNTKSSVIIDILSPYTNTSLTNLTTMTFEVKLDIKSPSLRLTSTDAYAQLSKNKVCIPVNHIKNIDKYYCYTYFNYKTNQMICRCNIADEISGVFDATLANAYKLIQFSPVSLSKVNYFSGSIILSSLGLIAIFSFLLLVYDIFDDRKLKQLDAMKRTERIKHEFSKLKYLNNCNVISFAWYLTYFKYPFLNVFSFYNYDHPRYFRFFIQIFCLLLSMFFSAIPYYKSNFDRKIAFIDERNIEDEKINVHNFPCYFSEVVSGFCYSLIASIVVIVVSAIFSKVLSFRKTRAAIWKPRKDILLSYVYDEIKSDVLLGDKWHGVKMRILAFNQLCGWSIVKRMKRRDKFSKYIDYKEGNYKYSMNFDKIELSKIENDFNEAPLLPSEEEKKTNNDSIYKGSDLEESVSELMRIESPVKGFTLNKRVKYPLAVTAIQKFERVKNKYILNHRIVDYRDDEESSIHISNDTRYEIVPNDNYTYISSKTISTKTHNPDNSKIILNFVINFILFTLLIGLYYLILVVFHDIYTTYEGFIVKAWLIPALFQVTVFKFVLSYALDLVIATILFRWGNKKRSFCLVKVVFALCIEKYMVYLNKIRLLITKYYKEFEFIQ